LNPLWVILSVVAGAQLAGFVGALLAIPAAGAIQVVLRELWQDWKAAHPTSVAADDVDEPPL
jgi:predicted PurR-regulated permease PerM